MGILFFLISPVFWWWVHGSRERYLWIISGPQPCSQFCSGPLQLWTGVVSGAVGITLFLLELRVRRRLVLRARRGG